MAKNFTIDFFELMFLTEACIPPRPIARSMFWERLINEIFYTLTPDQRKHLYLCMKRNDAYNPETNEDCALFEARFNPDNQYKITTLVKSTLKEGGQQLYYAFLWKDRKYYVAKDTFIDEGYIISAAKASMDEVPMASVYNEKRIEVLKTDIEEIKKRFPKNSVSKHRLISVIEKQIEKL